MFDAVVTVTSAARGVVGITRNMPPEESICLVLSSLLNTGTERER